MLLEIAKKLDDWVASQNLEAASQGFLRLRPCRIRVLGQIALLEGGAPLTLAATKDVDVYANYDSGIEAEFRRLLAQRGLELDPLGEEVWMPKETEYTSIFSGQYVELQLAEVDAILISKALKAPQKNRLVITEYLSTGASRRFLSLAKKYRVDLESFV